MKVLIIDDSPDALAVAKARLLKEDLQIFCADGGETGLQAAAEHKPDLILLDVNMPDISGFELCRQLKVDPDLRMIPVIFLSSSDTTEDRVRGLDIGAVDYVTKPFDAFELRGHGAGDGQFRRWGCGRLVQPGGADRVCRRSALSSQAGRSQPRRTGWGN